MAKGGKGRKGGGGGGGKTRKYSRDNNGRFASTGTGATARGGRLKTAAGNKRATVTAKTAKRASPSGAIKRSDVRDARMLNLMSKNIEARNKAGSNGRNGVPISIENQSTRLARAKERIAKRDPGAIKPKVTAAAKPKAIAAAPKAAKLPREQRLARAKVTAKRIDQKLKAKADETGAAFAERRRISSRASSKARTAAFEKEAVAGKASATALRASQRSNARVTRLNEEKGKYAQAARDAAAKPAAKPAPKSPEPAVKIAKRKPKTPAEIAAGREADRREMASILRKPARWLAPTPVAKPASKPVKKSRTPDAAKVSRIAARFQAQGAAPQNPSKVKRLNTIETRQRAMAFLAKPNSKGADAAGAVAQNIAKRKTYSTTTPNRNKPMARASLDQKTIREQNRKTTQGLATTRAQDTKKATQRVASPEPTTPRAKAASAQRIENRSSARKSANAAKAAANEVKYFRKDSDSQAYKNALAKRDRTLALRAPGTNKIAFRSRRMAIAAQRQRINNAVERTNIRLDRKRGEGVKRSSTGMTQLGLMGQGKKLFRVRKITGIKRPSGSKLARRLMR